MIDKFTKLRNAKLSRFRKKGVRISNCRCGVRSPKQSAVAKKTIQKKVRSSQTVPCLVLSVYVAPGSLLTQPEREGLFFQMVREVQRHSIENLVHRLSYLKVKK